MIEILSPLLRSQFTRSFFSSGFLTLTLGGMLMLTAYAPGFAATKLDIPSKSAEAIGGAQKTGNEDVLASLSKTGQAVRFSGLPAAKTVAIRYASVEVGTISVSAAARALSVSRSRAGGQSRTTRS